MQKNSLFRNSTQPFGPKSIKNKIMRQPVWEILHTSTHLQQKKKSQYNPGNTHFKMVRTQGSLTERLTRWEANRKTNNDHLFRLFFFGISDETELPTFRFSCLINHKPYFKRTRQDHQDSESKWSTNFDVKSFNGENFYRSILPYTST